MPSLKHLIKLVLWVALAFAAFVGLAVIVTSLVEYRLAVAAVFIFVGVIAFKFMSFKKALAYMVGFILVTGILLPKWQQLALVPYVERFRSNVREKIESAKQHDDHFPNDIAAVLDESAHEVGRTGRLYRILKARPHTYNSVTGEFTVESF